MPEIVKPVGGAILGVTIPIAIEYGVKGAKISDTLPYKWSGVIGTGLGAIEIGAALAGNAKRIGWPREDEDVAMMAAMGGAKLATGISILVLDELRKRALYSFKKKGTSLPIGEAEELQREEYPTMELVEEI